MTTTRASEPRTYRRSSTDEADRFAAEDPVSTIIELAHRHSSDLDVALYWERLSGDLWVLATDGRGHTTRVDATPRNALDVFHHPFAYAREAA
jgi:hypothetical protein